MSLTKALIGRIASAVVLIGSTTAIVWLALKTDIVSVFQAAWPEMGVTIFLGALLYCVCDLLLAIAWTTGFRIFGSARPTFSRGLVIFGQTNLYRYLPSNVMHFVGRQAWLSREGVSQRMIALISVWESAFLVVVAMIIGLASVSWNTTSALSHVAGLTALHYVVFAALAAAGLFGLLWFSGRCSSIGLGRRVRYASASAGLYLAFFFGTGVIAWLIFRGMEDLAAGLIELVGLSALAWVVGFVTPGASAGLGVREGVLIAALTSYTSIELATIIAVGSRASFVLGDMLFATCSWALAKQLNGSDRSP